MRTHPLLLTTIAMLLAPSVVAGGPAVFEGVIYPGLLDSTTIPGTSFAGMADEFAAQAILGQHFVARLTWPSDASLRIYASLNAPDDCIEWIACIPSVENQLDLCDTATTSLLTGANEAELSWDADVTGALHVYVEPELVQEPTPYRLEVSLDGDGDAFTMTDDDTTVMSVPALACTEV